MSILAHFARLVIARRVPPATVACFHNTVWKQCSFKDRHKDKVEKEKQLIQRQSGFFDEASLKTADDKQEMKNKKTFEDAIAVYLKREKAKRRGHVEFIYAALKRMKEFGVVTDLSTYKKLMEVFPKEKMVAKNSIQVEFMHYPRQQQCCIDLLSQMEENGVTPDDEMGYAVYFTFGKDTHAMRKYQRMMYWMPKFKNINPWPIPKTLPKDPTEIAKIALRRMAVDMENKLSTFWTETLDEAFDKTWIVSAQSPMQRELLMNHNSKNPLFVEGGFHVWARYKCLTYFCLRADPIHERLAEIDEITKKEKEKDSSLFDAESWKVFFEEEDLPKQVMKAPSVHEQVDGTIMAMCITGTASKDSLQSWINFLQASNPTLKDTPVVFKLITPEAGIERVDEEKDKEVSMPLSSYR